MVEEGTAIRTERRESCFPSVLFYRKDDKALVGFPVLDGITVKLVNERDYVVKTEIGRFKSKSRYRRLKGHKQPMSILRVESIKISSKKKGADK